MAYAWQHFSTITRHRHKVIAHCFRAGIGWQGLFHDLSKYSPSEFIPGAKHWQGVRSPNAVERELYGHSTAWMHHKGRNKHHFEYWTDYNIVSHKIEPVKMPLRYLIEMLCDRMAASKIYQGEKYTDRSPLEYFLNGRARYFMHPETADELERLLVILAEQGEEAVFAETRRLLREEKRA
ncbi:MAG: catalase [Clostridia bacterium]|nr:catalase [Clostridia bacterium]